MADQNNANGISIMKGSPTRKPEMNSFGKPKRRLPKNKGVEFKKDLEDVNVVESWKKYNQYSDDEEKTTKCKCQLF